MFVIKLHMDILGYFNPKLKHNKVIKAVLDYYSGKEPNIAYNAKEIKLARKWLSSHENNISITLEKLTMAEKLVSQKSSNNLILF